MTSQEIDDYLTKQLIIEKNIVTFRSLSRVFFIHVNAAKNALAAFYANSRGAPLTATYTLCGELKTPEYVYDDDEFKMEMDDYGMSDAQDEEHMDIEDDSDEPMQAGIMLVSEQDLEAQMARFLHVHSQTIHCLSPSPIKDANVLCPLTYELRKVDCSQKGVDNYRAFGRVIGKGIKIAVPKPLPRLPDVPKLSVYHARLQEARRAQAMGESSKPAQPPQLPGKPKGPNTLDFSKAKTKETKDKEKAELKAKGVVKEGSKTHVAKEEPGLSKTTSNAKASTSETGKVDKKKSDPGYQFFASRSSKGSAAAKSVKTETKEEKAPSPDAPKRGTKRKSPVGADSDDSSADESKPTTSKPTGLRVKKGVILSDDEDEAIIPPLRAGLRKGRVSSAASSVPDSEPPSDSEPGDTESEAERELKAMMDVDDDHVDRVTRAPAAKNIGDDGEDENENEDQGEADRMDEDVEMDDVDDVPKPKPKQRKSKKKAPIGSNGLKKKRVLKSEKVVDEKGYMVTRDYSDWETADEAEPPPIKKGKVKSKPSQEEEEASDSEHKPPSPKQVPPTKNKQADEVATKKATLKPTDSKSTGRRVIKPSASATKGKGKKGQPGIATFFQKS